MNYRHAFHAGNHADVLKHTVLTRVLDYMVRKDKPMALLDAHAGIGRYDLRGLEAQKTGEWREGIAKLVSVSNEPVAQALLRPYLDVIAALNPDRMLRHYPGSPELATRLLRKTDRLIFNELHPADADHLRAHFIADDRVRFTRADAGQAVKAELPFPEKRGVLLIDPAFEIPDETERVLRMVTHALRRMANLVILIWYPIKSAAFSASFHHAIKDVTDKPALACELMIKEAFSEGGLAGSGVAVINPPHVLHDEMLVLMPVLQKAMATPRWGRSHVSWINADL